MLTPDELRAMTPEATTQLLERLAANYYGTKNTWDALSRDMGVSRPTVFAWRRSNNTPWPVLFTLERWLNSEARAEQIMVAWGDIPAQLAEASAAMAKVAASCAKVARLSPSDPAIAQDD